MMDKNPMRIAYIDTCKRDYIEFMGVDDFDFSRNVINSATAKSQKAIARYINMAGTCKIEYDERIHLRPNNNKQVLFHEFTHLVDDKSFLLDNPCRKLLMHAYTEFHAGQVQFSQAIGLKKYNERGNISLESIMTTIIGMETVLNYLDGRRREYLSDMSKPNFPKTREDVYFGYGILMNYLGAISILYRNSGILMLQAKEEKEIYGEEHERICDALLNLTETDSKTIEDTGRLFAHLYKKKLDENSIPYCD